MQLGKITINVENHKNITFYSKSLDMSHTAVRTGGGGGGGGEGTLVPLHTFLKVFLFSPLFNF